MEIEFAGRHVVVTGGTGELGSAVVEILVEAGAVCHVPAHGRPASARLIGLPDDRVHLTPGVDLSDEGSVIAFYERVPSLWASVHCAGGFTMSPLAETPLSEFSRMMSINGLSCFLCSREAVRRIRDAKRTGGSGEGRIVNVAALSAVEPSRGAGRIAYAASKAVVAALTQGLAEEVAKEGIWVNAVAPSILDTPANRRSMPGADFALWPRIEEVAATIVFLASPQNRSTRGAVAPVFGRS